VRQFEYTLIFCNSKRLPISAFSALRYPMSGQPHHVPDEQVSIGVGAWVCILEGPMQNQWGKVLRVKQRSRLIVEVMQGGGVWIVELDSRLVAAPA
jgi:hypothetical protein